MLVEVLSEGCIVLNRIPFAQWLPPACRQGRDAKGLALALLWAEAIAEPVAAGTKGEQSCK